MLKMLLFLILFLLPSVNALYDNYAVCNNQSVEQFVNNIDALRFNESNVFWSLNDASNEIEVYRKTPGWFNNTENISIQKEAMISARGLALNRSSYSNKYFWIQGRGQNVTYKLNASGNITQNISLANTGIINPVAIDTIDGSRLFILDQDQQRIYEIDNRSIVYSTIELGREGTLNPTDFALILNQSKIKAIAVVYTTGPQVAITDIFGVRLKLLNISSLGQASISVIDTFDNETLWIGHATINYLWNITNDKIPPTITGPRINATRFQTGDTINISFNVNDNCAKYGARVASNESGRERNATQSGGQTNLDENSTGTQTIVLQWSSASVCSRDVSLRIVVNDTAGNYNQTDINVTTALPYMLNFQNNATEPWNCTAASSSNFTYTFGASSWINLTINMSLVIEGANVTCPYIAEGAELTNITTNVSNACRVTALNRKYTGAIITFQLSTALTAAGVSNLPAAIAVATVFSIIIAVAIARNKRNV
mgnify:CR=1 FL=1